MLEEERPNVDDIPKVHPSAYGLGQGSNDQDLQIERSDVREPKLNRGCTNPSRRGKPDVREPKLNRGCTNPI